MSLPRLLTRRHSSFVPRYAFPKYNIRKSDFKGHQMKALKKFEYLAPQLKMIIELRDIRAPLSTRNVLFDKILFSKKYDLERLIVYTKSDLMSHANSREYLKKLASWHDQMNEKFIIIDCRKVSDAKNLMDIINWSSKKTLEEGIPLPMGFRALVTGVPNLGKSTLVNSLRMLNADTYDPERIGRRKNIKVAKTGNVAGVTRSTSECIRISPSKSTQGVYLIDTPGIGLPGRASTDQRFLAQALCGCIKNNLIDPVILADFLLYTMNLQNCKHGEWYSSSTTNPTNDIDEVLNRLKSLKDLRKDDTAIALKWVNEWSKNGRDIVFDVEMLLSPDEFSYKDYVVQELKKLSDFEINAASTIKRHGANRSVFQL
ncbi:putative GTPase MTG1 KNAG_0E02490 [Huiozyma naganishii CBS 8797]|uniref:G domain-containing protein n=1 Tax=Huiozyma naganishii (strain ATCC MYA-139 / BCRC 22969 / CBS 8797 / KCTC 17520 / NBRC 10181 / NCYC 3082 / Yp74L-3) TaxID=1071383 RepID=J7S6Q8_HUIN7|nr:hypothetical protein KNAG_0E02490 [Kazachstania naganishii CBS 8797]CCK70509.1 hypothetical protein KNAG_0E02490 [Kazachstania naganishii CBS 8797]